MAKRRYIVNAAKVRMRLKHYSNTKQGIKPLLFLLTIGKFMVKFCYRAIPYEKQCGRRGLKTSPFFELFIKKQGQYFLCARSVFFVCWIFQTQKQIFLLYFAVLSHYYVIFSHNLVFQFSSVTKKLLKIKIKGAFRHKNPLNEAILYLKTALDVIFPQI